MPHLSNEVIMSRDFKYRFGVSLYEARYKQGQPTRHRAQRNTREKLSEHNRPRFGLKKDLSASCLSRTDRTQVCIGFHGGIGVSGTIKMIKSWLVW